MKKLFYAVLIAVVVFLFYPAKPHTRVRKWQTKVKSVVTPKKDYTKEISRKTEELAALERMHNELTTQITAAIANAPICPCTGKKATLQIKSDPRFKLRAECQVLRQEIWELQTKIR